MSWAMPVESMYRQCSRSTISGASEARALSSCSSELILGGEIELPRNSEDRDFTFLL